LVPWCFLAMPHYVPGLPDGPFSNKKPNLGKFWRDLQWKMLVYFRGIWSILWPFGIFYGYLVYILQFWYVLPRKIWQSCYVHWIEAEKAIIKTKNFANSFLQCDKKWFWKETKRF
jgi:hypothetical protein